METLKHMSKEPVENMREMEVGRLKERLIEAVKILPGTIKDMASIYVLAMKSLGTPEEEINNELQALTGRMIERSDEARERADTSFDSGSEAAPSVE